MKRPPVGDPLTVLYQVLAESHYQSPGMHVNSLKMIAVSRWFLDFLHSVLPMSMYGSVTSLPSRALFKFLTHRESITNGCFCHSVWGNPGKTTLTLRKTEHLP